MVCADFDAYRAADEAAVALYRDRHAWARRALFNIAGAGAFSSDATIRAYAEEIWNLKPQKANLGLAAPVPVPATPAWTSQPSE
jgi:starch phosphorylase